MRSLGHGYAGIKKFNTLMNIPKPITVKNYNKTVSRITKVVKTVAEETMDEAAKETYDSAASTDDIINTNVSGDGTWQRKGFSNFNGVFKAISIESGKVLDVRPMSRYFKDCNLKKDLKVKNPTAYAEWKNVHICRYNYKGSAGGVEAEGVKRVFERSIKKHKLRYVEFLGDGDTKSYVNVKDTYPGIEFKKL